MTRPSSNPVLYLTHRVPYPPDKGDRIRNFHLLRHVARRGRVWLGCLADEPVRAGTLEALRQHCEEVAIVPVGRLVRWLSAGTSLIRGGSISEGRFAHRTLRRTIREWTARTSFRTAVVSASSLAPYLRGNGLEATPGVVDLVDVDSQKWREFAATSGVPRRWVYQVEAARVRRLEADISLWAKAVAVVSRAEADLFDAVAIPAGGTAATVATNGVDLEYFRPGQEDGDPSCVFVGAMDYWPNVDGAVWFAREVWPSVRTRVPSARFQIVGRQPAPAVRALGALPGVAVTGSVSDVRPWLMAARVVVAPLRLARGVQNKVLEAMAMARPVVAAPAALAALQTTPGKHVLKAETPGEWVEAVTGLLLDADRGRVLGAAGRQYVEENHRWEKCLEPLVEKIFG